MSSAASRAGDCDMEVRCNVDDSDVSPEGSMAKNNMRRHSATSFDWAQDNAGQYPGKYIPMKWRVKDTNIQAKPEQHSGQRQYYHVFIKDVDLICSGQKHIDQIKTSKNFETHFFIFWIGKIIFDQSLINFIERRKTEDLIENNSFLWMIIKTENIFKWI